MKLEFREFKSVGELSKERLVFRASGDGDVGSFIVFASQSLNGESFNGEVDRTYWLPDKPVKDGDLIVVYSKSGTDTQVVNQNGSTSHFFYIGSDSSIWKKRDRCMILLEGESWEVRPVKKVDVDVADEEPPAGLGKQGPE